jgi:murein DD-endopeptidase MepM/ murein hydrolase activator NlpD
MIDGHLYESADFPPQTYEWPLYYYSVGVKVLSLADGYISSYGTYRGSPTASVPSDYVSKCASVTFKETDASGNVVRTYWLGHMSFDPARQSGDVFKAGDVIGEVGPPQCAVGTQAHLHIHVSPQVGNDRFIIDLIDKLYEALPES